MKYYRIYHSSGKDIGHYPQVFHAELNFHIEDKNSSAKLAFSKASGKTLWPVPKLYGRAKKTDLISISFVSLSNVLFVSAKLYNILSSVECKGIEFIKSEHITKKGREEYWIINPFLSDYSFIDIKESVFVYTDRMCQQEFETAVFDSVDSFIGEYQQNRIDAIQKGYNDHRPLIIKKIAFRNDCSVDFFSVSGVSGGIGFFLSEKFKNEIEAEGCTGIVFKEPNEKPY